MAVVGFAVAFPLIQLLNITVGTWLLFLPTIVRGAGDGCGHDRSDDVWLDASSDTFGGGLALSG
jgi:hypothetical protein